MKHKTITYKICKGKVFDGNTIDDLHSDELKNHYIIYCTKTNEYVLGKNYQELIGNFFNNLYSYLITSIFDFENLPPTLEFDSRTIKSFKKISKKENALIIKQILNLMY